MSHLYKRRLTFNATVQELATLVAACADLHDSTPQVLHLGEITLRNVIVIEVSSDNGKELDARTGIPNTVQATVHYYVLPKEET